MAEPTRKDRAGDSQPLPIVQNDTVDIQLQVIADIMKRRELGIERYGTPLQADNGRDALLDAYEEAMDLTMYLKQALVEDVRDRMVWLSIWADLLAEEIRKVFPVTQGADVIEATVARANELYQQAIGD